MRGIFVLAVSVLLFLNYNILAASDSEEIKKIEYRIVKTGKNVTFFFKWTPVKEAHYYTIFIDGNAYDVVESKFEWAAPVYTYGTKREVIVIARRNAITSEKLENELKGIQNKIYIDVPN